MTQINPVLRNKRGKSSRSYQAKASQPPPLSLLWRIFKSLAGAFVIWIGETVIGLIPLATHYIVSTYSYVENSHAHGEVISHIAEAPLAEMNILTVVISGLGLLSLLSFGHHGRQARFTPMTYLAGLAALVLLISSSVLYALMTAGIGSGNDSVTFDILIFAVLVSLFLALEPAWLEALNET